MRPGASGIYKGATVNWDLVLGKDTVIDVSGNDGTTDLGKLMKVAINFVVNVGLSLFLT